MFIVPHIILVIVDNFLIILIIVDTISLYYVNFSYSRQDSDDTILDFDNKRQVLKVPENILIMPGKILIKPCKILLITWMIFMTPLQVSIMQ